MDPLTNKSFWNGLSTYKFEPKTYSTWLLGRNGAIITELFDVTDAAKTNRVGWFIRNQLLRLDIFGGNSSINGWDG